MKEFLRFQTFITPALLMFIYYIGALVIHLLSWYFAGWIIKVHFSEISE
jgi:hypothetical protein